MLATPLHGESKKDFQNPRADIVLPVTQGTGGGSVCKMAPTRNVSLFIQSCQDVTSGLTAGEAPRRDERRFAGEATDLGAGEGERPVERPREDPTGRPGLLERALPPFFGMIVTGAGRQTERTRSLGPTLTPWRSNSPVRWSKQCF